MTARLVIAAFCGLVAFGVWGGAPDVSLGDARSGTPVLRLGCVVPYTERRGASYAFVEIANGPPAAAADVQLLVNGSPAGQVVRVGRPDPSRFFMVVWGPGDMAEGRTVSLRARVGAARSAPQTVRVLRRFTSRRISVADYERREAIRCAVPVPEVTGRLIERGTRLTRVNVFPVLPGSRVRMRCTSRSGSPCATRSSEPRRPRFRGLAGYQQQLKVATLRTDFEIEPRSRIEVEVSHTGLFGSHVRYVIVPRNVREAEAHPQYVEGSDEFVLSHRSCVRRGDRGLERFRCREPTRLPTARESELFGGS